MLKVLGTVVTVVGLAAASGCGMMGDNRSGSGGGTSASGSSSGSGMARCEGLSGEALQRCRAQQSGGASPSTR